MHASVSEGPRGRPEAVPLARCVRESRTRRCVFLPEGRPIERNTWCCGNGIGPGPGSPRADSSRIVEETSRRRARPRFSSSANTLDNGVCCSPSGPAQERVGGPPRSEDPGNLLGMLLDARVFCIIKPFKYRRRNVGTTTIYTCVYVTCVLPCKDDKTRIDFCSARTFVFVHEHFHLMTRNKKRARSCYLLQLS